MSRKSKKKTQATIPVAAAVNAIAVKPDNSPEPQFRLADMKASARVHLDNNAWAEILLLGRVPLTAIHLDDRKEAEVWLLRGKIIGLRSPVLSHYDLPIDAREELKSALEQLASCVDTLHTMYEFQWYLEIQNWSVDGSAKAFRLLTRACMELTNVEWLRKLRGYTLRLQRAQEGHDEEISAADQETLDALPDLPLTLTEVYAAAEQSDALDEEGRALVHVLRLDLDLMMADPWDYTRVGGALLRLPSPSESVLVAMPEDESSGSSHLRLTPRAWAFMWMLEHAPCDGFIGLLERFPDPFACDACEGLRRVLCALSAAPASVDEQLSLAVRALMRFADAESQHFGEHLTMTLAEGVQEIYVGPAGLHMASVGDLLLRLYEHSPEGFARQSELESLYRIFTASNDYSPLEDEPNGDQDMPGLAWLCEQSLSFQLAAAFAIQGVGGRMRLLLDAMHRATIAGVLLPRDYYSGNFGDAELDEPEAQSVLDALEQLSAVRDQLFEHTRRMWLEVVGDIFDALSKSGDKVQARLLALARDFSDDLLEKGHEFRLAYLEQVAGDPDDALHYYLIDLDNGENLHDTSVKNAKLLWARSEVLSQVRQFVDKLQEAISTSRRADVVQQLLTDAKTRLATLNQRDQFERTAVNRWPSLTAPARKLLSVFASIKSYNGLAKVAGYAGMDLTWAGRHYDKLVELGMLFVTDKKFRINPHIKPLLEREAQHSVIGRIVRSQGSSAVKQVFNSQLEFTIYQVLVQLCPNHLVFPNCSLQSVMSYDRIKELTNEDDFGYYLRASVDIVVVSSTTYLPMLAIEVDSVWHDTERQQRNDNKKDRLFAAAGIPFMRLRPVGSPSENTIRAQVAEHVDELVRSLRADLPGYDQARGLLEDLSGVRS